LCLQYNQYVVVVVVIIIIIILLLLRLTKQQMPLGGDLNEDEMEVRLLKNQQWAVFGRIFISKRSITVVLDLTDCRAVGALSSDLTFCEDTV